jgi:hypothetical protein
MNETERLAQGFVEATTDLDYAPLPDAVKERLLSAAAALLQWRANSVYVMAATSHSVSQSKSAPDTH